MPILSPLGNLFGRSPIGPIQEHMAMVDQAAQLVPDLLRASAADDWDSAALLHQDIAPKRRPPRTSKSAPYAGTCPIVSFCLYPGPIY
jgi:hypothetical protein